jgi:hypothetical protein
MRPDTTFVPARTLDIETRYSHAQLFVFAWRIGFLSWQATFPRSVNCIKWKFRRRCTQPPVQHPQCFTDSSIKLSKGTKLRRHSGNAKRGPYPLKRTNVTPEAKGRP